MEANPMNWGSNELLAGDALCPRPKGWCVYLILCGDFSIYCGCTNDIHRRIKMHKEGKGAKYTRGRGPLFLIYTEKVESKSKALKREYEIKSMSRKRKLDLWEKQRKGDVTCH